ncbi:MAG: MASE1 domain-containing protein [Gemmatimonadota bacterium]|nr:MASE1 domain-containing protein [Gemmatimonadota bacterium]
MNVRAVLTNVALAAAYAAAGAATLSFPQIGGPNLSSMLWIGSGIALAVALQVPFPVWPGVAAGAILATLSDGSPWTHALATGVANAGEIWLALFLLRKTGFNSRFGTVRDVMLLVALACGVAAAVTALLSVTSLVVTGGAPPAAFGRIWLMWWLTHGMGILVVVPFALSVRARDGELTRATRRETAALLAAIGITAWISFSAPPTSLRAELFFLPFPLLLLAGVRSDALVATGGAFLVTVLAIGGALVLRGPFSFGTANEALFLTWSFASVTIVATVIATAAVRERTLAEREVQRGEQRLRAVLEATSEGILVADDVGRVTDVNSSFLKLVGREPADPPAPDAHVGTFLRSLRPTGDDGPVTCPTVLDPDVGQEAKITGEVRLDDGRILEAESVPLVGSTDRGGRVWTTRDITQRVESEEERRRLHEQILHSQKLEGLGVLAGGVAHDFNNILAGIMGYAELLLAQPELDDEGRDDAEGIIQAAQHAAGLCGQLLTYAGKTTAMLSPLDLASCTRDMRQFMALSVGKHVDLEFETPDDPVMAIADEVQIRQVIFNLVTNASEAVLESNGSGRVVVRVGSRFCDGRWLGRAYGAQGLPETDYAIVEVEDDGIGMDPETVGQIFDPFYSSKGTGRGLGLSAVLGMLKSHKGALIVETEAGLGTRFQIALPQSERSSKAVDTRASPRRVSGNGPANILVVDDESVVRETVARMLRRDGHEVIEAAHGDAALELLAERHDEVDLIVLDLTMPHRDGLSTLSEMKDRGYGIPVLLASGYSGEAVPPEESVAGFLQKPFRSAELRERVATVLGEATTA